MTAAVMFLKIAKDEAKTLVEYQEMLDELDEELDEKSQSIVNEIMSDEYNHALIALLTASAITGVKIATDELEPNPNDMKVEEELGELEEDE